MGILVYGHLDLYGLSSWAADLDFTVTDNVDTHCSLWWEPSQTVPWWDTCRLYICFTCMGELNGLAGIDVWNIKDFRAKCGIRHVSFLNLVDRSFPFLLLSLYLLFIFLFSFSLSFPFSLFIPSFLFPFLSFPFPKPNLCLRSTR